MPVQIKQSQALRSRLVIVSIALIAAVGSFMIAINRNMDPALATKVPTTLGKIALSFERNDGKTDQSVQYLAHEHGRTFFFAPSEVNVALKGPNAVSQALHVRFVAANPPTDLRP